MKTLAFVFLIAFHFTLMAQTEITSQGTTYKLPDIGELKSPEALRSAAATAQLAAGALTTEAAGLNASAKAAEADLTVLGDKVADYRSKLDSYNKNTLGPYTEDLNQYKANLDKYTSLVNAYNSEVAASDALPATQRDPAKIASLNGRKAGFDDWLGKLNTWKGTLDVKKAQADLELQNLNNIREVLLPQYNDGKQRLSDLRARFKLAYDQLLACKAYADKCKATLKANYPTYTGIATTGPFGTKVWSGTMSDLQTSMERLKALSGKVFDGN